MSVKRSIVMKRSSSKLIVKAGSVRHINKLAYKFKFELHVESVDKLLGSSDVVVTWERGSKVLSTSPARIDKSTRSASFGGQVLEQEITLFKRKKEGSAFEDKVYRLTCRQNSERGKVIGRIDVNFSEYVDIPSFSRRIAATLSNGGQVIMRVQSNFLGEAKRRKNGSLGSSSVGSSAFAADAAADLGEDPRERDLDLVDLDISEDAAPMPQPVQVSRSRRNNARASPSSTAPNDPDVDPYNLALANGAKKGPGKSSSANNSADRSERKTPGKLKASKNFQSTDEGSTRATPSRTEFERLRRENRALRNKNDELGQRVEELAHKMNSGAFANGSLEELQSENDTLRRDIGDLKGRLAREPVYADVVRELREAKMALAILTMEKDELAQQLRNRSR